LINDTGDLNGSLEWPLRHALNSPRKRDLRRPFRERLALAGRVFEKELEQRSFSARSLIRFSDNPDHAGCLENPRSCGRPALGAAALVAIERKKPN
jgi:hypothetical protein